MKNVRITIEDNLIRKVEESDRTELITTYGYADFGNCEVLPGLTDSHCHVWGMGMINSGLDVSAGKSAEETAEIALKNNFMRGDWIAGRGWNNELWKNKSLPSKEVLDKIFPDKPTALTRVDGHAIWCNSKALEIAGINRNSPNPDGGKILKDESGEPTGILVDIAMEIINKIIPKFTEQQLEKFILKGLDICLSSGITAVHDMDVSPEQIKIYMKLNEAEKLPVRVFIYAACQNDEAFTNGIHSYSTFMLHVKGIKLYADGALGSYGAALLEDYSDMPGEKGILMMNAETMLPKMLKAVDMELDIAVHAIGDRANREVLDAYEQLRKLRPKCKSKLRIEHAQIVNPEDLLRFKELNVVASVQPVHFVSDSDMAFKRLGEERLVNSGYLWKSFIENEILVIGGSDFPIESHKPFTGINAFTKRLNNLPFAGKLEKEIISYDEAAECYTSKPYKVIGIRNVGKIDAGYLADFVFFENMSGDLLPEIKAVYIHGKRVK